MKSLTIIAWVITTLVLGASAPTVAGSSEGSIPAILSFLLSDNPLPYNISMIEPYRDESKIDVIAEAYSEAGSVLPPWCPMPPQCPHPHDGIDFMPIENLVEIQSVAHGTVETVEKYGSRGQITVIIRYNDKYAVNYAFEPQDAAYSDIQLAQIAVAKGDWVVPGQLVGKLVKPVSNPDAAHLHFGLIIDHAQDCPDPFFTLAARTSVLRILHKRYPGANICYLAP